MAEATEAVKEGESSEASKMPLVEELIVTPTALPIIEKTVSLEDLRALVFPINTHSPEGKEAVKKTLSQLGAESFSKITEDKYPLAAELFTSVQIQFGIKPSL
jgi:hypothetical protein